MTETETERYEVLMMSFCGWVGWKLRDVNGGIEAVGGICQARNSRGMSMESHDMNWLSALQLSTMCERRTTWNLIIQGHVHKLESSRQLLTSKTTNRT